MGRTIMFSAVVTIAIAAAAGPPAYTWQVDNMNLVSGPELQIPHVWLQGKTATFTDCQNLCAANASCLSMDWSDSFAASTDPIVNGTCGYLHNCYFRNDHFWSPVANGNCNHSCARKFYTPDPPLGYQPNIIFILTDDQDVRLGASDEYTRFGSLAVQRNTQEHLVQAGVFFDNFFVNTPICCPSRTESFSGRYYHNVGPPAVEGSCMHVDTTQAVGPSSLFGALTALGYHTGVFGKVTNDQATILPLATQDHSMEYIDSPLDYNNYLCTTYYRQAANWSAHTETLDPADPIFGTLYQTTQIGNRTLRWLDEWATTADGKPFFAYIGPHAPHFPAQPAPWYEDVFDDVTIPITPNYNTSSPNKTQHIRQNPPLSELARCWENQHFRDRWRTLLSVDDIVGDLVAKLDAMGQLNRTFIFYSSDNGYKQGQWRIGTSKQHPYETDVHTPLIVRGPETTCHPLTRVSIMAANVDLLPTMLELAGGAASMPPLVDGKSLLHTLVPAAVPPAARHARAAEWRSAFLIEYKSVGTYYNDHSNCWEQGNATTVQCGGAMPVGPAGPVTDCVEATGVGTGNCYFIDSTLSNNWRMLRVIDGTDDLAYIEYDPTFQFKTDDPTGAGLQYYEMYDLATDPYQLNNIYEASSAATRTRLHGQISAYFACKATDTSPSNCP